MTELEKAEEALAEKDIAMRECGCGVCKANHVLATRRLARAKGEKLPPLIQQGAAGEAGP